MQIFDPLSAGLVGGGTVAATLLRCGPRDFAAAARTLARLPRRRFDPAAIRAELAAQVQEIGRDGLVRAQPHQFGDGEFDMAADALIRSRSVEALFDRHEEFRQRRAREADGAVEVLGQAAELAPVLGLAGTLLSLGALPGTLLAGSGYAVAISGAVTTTLYGLVLAHFVFAPLAAAVARRAAQEESQRRELMDWLAGAVRRLRPVAAAPAEQAA